MQKRRIIKLFRIGGGLLSVAIAAVAVSHALGGPVSIVVVTGSSMEPALHSGDAVVAWSEPGYERGDVVAYRSDQLDAVVLHRIVDREGSRYVMKGDNNDWLDPDEPTADSVIGRRLVTIPGVGTATKTLSSAPGVGLVGLGGLVWVAAKARRRRRDATSPSARPAATLRTVLLVVAGMSTIGCAVLAIVAFTAPSEGPSSVRHSYAHEGKFGYSAQVTPGAAYRSGEVSTGDAVFLRLVSSLDVSFDYRFDSESRHGVSGRGTLLASIGDGLGWRHMIPLSQPVPLEDGRARLEGTLDLRRIQDVIDEMEQSTGLSAQIYTIQLVAKTEVSGEVAGVPIVEKFSPRYPLSLDHIRLQPAADPTPQDGNDPRHPTQNATIDDARTGSPSAGVWSSNGVALPAAVGFVLSLLAVAVIGSNGKRAATEDATLIRSALRRRLVPVRDAEPGAGPVVDVGSARAFVDLARRFDVVMEADTIHGTLFLVHDGSTTYRYGCGHVRVPPAPRVEGAAGVA